MFKGDYWELAAIAIAAVLITSAAAIDVAAQGAAVSGAPAYSQPSAADQWFGKTQGDMGSLTQTLNLGLTAINSDMEHLRQQLALTERQLATAELQLKAARAELAAKAKKAPGKNPTDHPRPGPAVHP